MKYPEKLMYSILKQLNINFEYQKLFPWSPDKYYDFYLPDFNLIVETHGQQHYEYTGFTRTLEEEQSNDNLKLHRAKDNGMTHYVVVDCAVSNLEYIKNNIMESILRELLNLTEVDWDEAHNFALNSLVRVACDLWSDGFGDVTKICEELKLSRPTIIAYLKKGNGLGWCNYNPKEIKRANAKNNRPDLRRPVVQLTKEHNLVTEYESVAEASRKTKIHHSLIRKVCSNKRKTAGSYIWMDLEKYEKWVETNFV